MLGIDLRRAGLFAVVFGMHAVFALALAQWHTVTRTVHPVVVLETSFFPEEKHHQEPQLPVINVHPMRVRIDAPVPMVEVDIDALTEAPPSPRAPLAMVASRTHEAAAGPVLVEQVQYVHPPKPRYPGLSRKLREQGVVVLKVLVNEHGQAEDIQVTDSSGYERLDQAAVEAVAAATFRPFLQNGTARAMLVLIPIEFGLQRVRT